MEIKENYPLKSHNTFGMNVYAKYFVEVSSIADLKKIFSDEKFISEKKIVLGGGSNILFTDNFNGLVIKNNIFGIDLISENEDYIFIRAGAGENWHQFVLYCIKNNYSGIENLSLIPGTVGAAPMQNIGAYGIEIKDVFESLEAFDITSHEIRSFSNEECQFGYRNSIFKNELKNKYIITSVTFKLKKKPVFNISYGAIKDTLSEMGITEISISSISDAVCHIRRSKLPDPNVIGNAGSFFKNPEIDINHFEKLKTEYPDIVSYKVNSEKVKIPAGWLIEKAGWKGKTFDNYGVHKNQALVLVNYGTAKGNDIKTLSQEIVRDISTKFGIDLETEVNII